LDGYSIKRQGFCTKVLAGTRERNIMPPARDREVKRGQQNGNLCKRFTCILQKLSLLPNRPRQEKGEVGKRKA